MTKFYYCHALWMMPHIATEETALHTVSELHRYADSWVDMPFEDVYRELDVMTIDSATYIRCIQGTDDATLEALVRFFDSEDRPLDG